jgi:hypothetical protein
MKVQKNSEIPLYKTSYDLFLFTLKMVKDINRDYKFSVGDFLRNETMCLLKKVCDANKTTDKEAKKENIEKAQSNTETITFLCRALFELREIPLKKYTNISLMTEDISRQLAAWYKSLK